MGSSISHLVLILLNKMELLNVKIDILLRQLIPSFSIGMFFFVLGECCSYSCYLINRMPSSILHYQIPHSLLFPTQPLYFLPSRVFGCTCFIHTLTPGQDKLSAKAMKCIFLGYSRLQKGYHCYSPDTHHYFLSVDVTFFEDSPFFSSSESLPISETMVDEMAALHSNGTWDLVSLSPGKSTATPFNHFQTKDLGKLKYYLGLEIAQSSSSVVMSQRKYALDILEEIGMLECKLVNTPMDPNVNLYQDRGSL
ncbi:Retrovirus-related Pol polyprotein from transposon TNT 1-94 [Vitis vinifera]|uniref:Retrovirus-related Pol polyprotein from transposon TNT 1-94 n=1 Tax=Vitis vinifera TaxID=29760 RepID=A0A438H3M2_VITVI|nr:Retrovirus-related Pol polyprotein from transposon TNT 1-94 [Vitis vinifera]